MSNDGSGDLTGDHPLVQVVVVTLELPNAIHGTGIFTG